MSIELREIQPGVSSKGNWEQLKVLLEPIVDNLPREEDRDYFKGPLSFLIGKEPRISNIPKNLMFIYIRKARFIAKCEYYVDLLGWKFIKRELINFLSELALSLGEEGLLVKFGVGGFQRSFVEQRVIQEHPEEKKKGWLW